MKCARVLNVLKCCSYCNCFWSFVGSILLIVAIYYIFGFDKLFALFGGGDSEKDTENTTATTGDYLRGTMSDTMAAVKRLFSFSEDVTKENAEITTTTEATATETATTEAVTTAIPTVTN